MRHSHPSYPAAAGLASASRLRFPVLIRPHTFANYPPGSAAKLGAAIDCCARSARRRRWHRGSGPPLGPAGALGVAAVPPHERVNKGDPGEHDPRPGFDRNPRLDSRNDLDGDHPNVDPAVQSSRDQLKASDRTLGERRVGHHDPADRRGDDGRRALQAHHHQRSAEDVFDQLMHPERPADSHPREPTASDRSRAFVGFIESRRPRTTTEDSRGLGAVLVLLSLGRLRST